MKQVPRRRTGSYVTKVSSSGNHSQVERLASQPEISSAFVSPVSASAKSGFAGIATIQISKDLDIITARQEGRRLAEELGFHLTDLALVATAISELARNILRFARTGELTIRDITNRAHIGLEIVARDSGPGIKDINQVMQIGFSSCGGLGLGLPGVRRLMDEFEIQSAPGLGTTVTAKKWKS